jgi:predicted XRE-type DNA-binding protein
MTLSYDNILDAVSESPEQASLDKKCSDLMIEIHRMLDLKNEPIKTIVQVLGLTPEQARNLVKGKTEKFSFYELQTFIERLSSSNK